MKTQPACPVVPSFAALIISLILMAGAERGRAQTWSTDQPLDAARWRHTATLLTNGTVLIAGGIILNTNGDFANTNSAEIYDPSAGGSADTGFMQDFRDTFRATLLTNGQVLVCGGGGDATSELYDPGSATWINLATMNNERQYHTATLLTNGMVLAAGGYDGTGAGELASAELYNPVAGTWASTAAMPYAADSLAAVLLTNGLVLVCGGSIGGSNTNGALLYHPASHTWTTTASMKEARAGHTATLLTSGKVLVEGGTYDNTAEVYDPVAATWTFVADMNVGHAYALAVRLNNGQVLVTGDGDSDAEVYVPSANIWTNIDALPVPGNLQQMTLLANGGVLVTGGSGTQYNGPALDIAETFAGPAIPGLTVTASPTTGLAQLHVQFTSPGVDSVGNTVTNWSWIFGDGSSSTAQSPLHIYTNAGAYSPSLTAYSTFGNTPLLVSGSGSITVTNPTLTVTASPSFGLPSLTVHFTSPGTDSIGDTVTNWSWIFGDGGVSTNQSPNHIYTNAGSYSPALTAFSTFGKTALTIIGPGSITVTNPFLTVSDSPQSGDLPLAVQFTSPGTDSAGFTVTNWNWTFGDGVTSTQQSPKHVYVTAGNFNPALTAYSTYGKNPLSVTGPAAVSVTTPPNPFFRTVYAFTGGNDGSGVNPVIVAGSTIYGTAGGGTSNSGTIFSLNTDGTGLTNLFYFSQAVGIGPSSPAFTLSGSNLCGTTYLYGSGGWGNVFVIRTNGTGFTNVVSFNNPGPGTGSEPLAGVVSSSNVLYGLTEFGGGFNQGALFAVNAVGGGFSDLVSFDPYTTGPSGLLNSDGLFPQSRLIASGSTLYGTAENGGTNSAGTVFAYTLGTGFKVLHYFTSAVTGTNQDGAYPFDGLVLSGSTLYGVTRYGGTNGFGVVYAINTDGTGFTNLYNFTGGRDGANPNGPLAVWGNTLIGTATGGISTNGTLFALRTSGLGFTNLYDFTGGNYGYNPAGAPYLVGNTLYGAAAGGAANNGLIYTYTLQTPQLTITQAGTNVLLRWPAYFTGYTLQFTTNLATNVAWNTAAPLPVVVNSQNTVTNPIAASTRKFYRLTQ
ncbi:MAG TPA: choice-of-anchor tandem repeat GloVer-containing protein [Candidatus Acidoferrales bacterium]|nr:choice-of-anchor tandem repeat GloVer-containing protein [Candidatus Acidoferrales bacterium]